MIRIRHKKTEEVLFRGRVLIPVKQDKHSISVPEQTIKVSTHSEKGPSLELAEEKLESEMEIIENLEKDVITPKLSDLINEQSGAIVKHILGREKLGHHFEQVFKEVTSLGTTLDLIEEGLAKPVELLGNNLFGIDNVVVNDFTLPIFTAELAITIPESFSIGAVIIYQRAVLRAMKRYVELKSGQMTGEEKILLDQWIKTQEATLKKKLMFFILGKATYAPRGVKTVLGLAGKITSKFMVGYLWVVTVLAAILYTLKLRKFKKEEKVHTEWMQRPQHELKDIKTLLEARQRREEKLQIVNRNKLTQIIEELHTDKFAYLKWRDKYGINIQNIAKGINFDNPEEAIKKLKTEVEKQVDGKPVTKFELLLNQYTQHLETKRVLARQGIHALTALKHKQEHKFLKVRSTKLKIQLVAKVVALGILATFKTLAMKGIIASTTLAFGLTGAGMFILIGAALIFGLVMVYKYRRNLLDEVRKMVKARLLFRKIPASILKFRLQNQKLNRLKLALTTEEYGAKIGSLESMLIVRQTLKLNDLPERYAPALKRLKLDKKKEVTLTDFRDAKATYDQQVKERAQELELKIKNLSERAIKRQKRVNELQARLDEARLKDFKIVAKIVDEKGDKSIDEVLVESLFRNQEFVDEDTRRIFYEELGIDLSKLPEKYDNNEKQAIQNAIKTFYSLSEEDIVKFVKKQKTLFKMKAEQAKIKESSNDRS